MCSLSLSLGGASSQGNVLSCKCELAPTRCGYACYAGLVWLPPLLLFCPPQPPQPPQTPQRSQPPQPPQVLNEGPVMEEDAWQILRGILAGLVHIHSQGIIHRDLKVRAALCQGVISAASVRREKRCVWA